MANNDDPPRLSVVAAIMDAKTIANGALRPEARLGTRYASAAGSQAAASATPSEQEIAQALQGQSPGADAEGELAMAELLVLADQPPLADDLATRLKQAFLLPDDRQLATDSQPATARHERTAAFAGLYRKFALHQLNSQVRNKAAAILARLSRP